MRFAAALVRGVIATFAGLLVAGGTLTIAADRVAQRPTLVAVTATPNRLTVPQVTGQAYVFAKGILQDGGFAWRVQGTVQGYAGNTVVDQSPAPGSIVVDTGAPTITLILQKTPSYAERGTPDNGSPYVGTAAELAANSPPVGRVPRLTPAVRQPTSN